MCELAFGVQGCCSAMASYELRADLSCPFSSPFAATALRWTERRVTTGLLQAQLLWQSLGASGVTGDDAPSSEGEGWEQASGVQREAWGGCIMARAALLCSIFGFRSLREAVARREHAENERRAARRASADCPTAGLYPDHLDLVSQRRALTMTYSERSIAYHVPRGIVRGGRRRAPKTAERFFLSCHSLLSLTTPCYSASSPLCS